MEARKRVVDLSLVLNSTVTAKARVKRAKEIIEDPRKADRLKEQECVVCFYNRPRISGRMISAVKCGYCDEEKRFANTDVDVLCEKCAKEFGLCKHCGADINLKNRHKLERKK